MIEKAKPRFRWLVSSRAIRRPEGWKNDTFKKWDQNPDASMVTIFGSLGQCNYLVRL